MANTISRGYPKPVSDHFVSDDVLLLLQAFDMIDADVEALITALNGKAQVVHTHSMGDVAGLSQALDGKAAIDHKHGLDDLRNVGGTATAPDGVVLAKLSGQWVPQTPASVLGVHSHSIGDITNLATILGAKFDASSLAALGLKTLPVDTDTVVGLDSADGNAPKRFSWAALKAALKTYFDTLYTAAGYGVPTGAVIDWHGSTAPAGLLFCLGQAVTRTGANANLFAQVGIKFGSGDGLTTFNLPTRASEIGGSAKIIKT